MEADVVSIIVGIATGVGALIAVPSGRLTDRTGHEKLFVFGSFLSFLGVKLIPFFVSVGLGLFTVSLVMLFVREQRHSSVDEAADA